MDKRIIGIKMLLKNKRFVTNKQILISLLT